MKTTTNFHNVEIQTATARRHATSIYATARILSSLLLALAIPNQLSAAGPAPVNLYSTSTFLILAGTPGITTTGGGTIAGDVGLSPGPGSGIGVTCAQVTGTIYAVDATGPACAVNNAAFLTTVKGDLTTAYNDARLRTVSVIVNPGTAGNLGGLTLAPGLYKINTTTSIAGSDLTLAGGPDDVWIFQCDVDLIVEAGVNRSVILSGGAQAKNVFWQVTSSATIGTFAHFQGNILALTSITMGTSSTMVGRALARNGSVTYNGAGAAVPTPVIGVQQPVGTNLVNNVVTNDFGSVLVGTNTSHIFAITNRGTASLTISGITIDGTNSASFSVTNLSATLSPGGITNFTVNFAPTNAGVQIAALHVASDDNNNNPFNIALTGMGTNGPPPIIGVQQPLGTNLTNGVGTNNFGSVALGTNASLTFTITNSGSADLTGLVITIDGSNSVLFTVTTNPVAPVVSGSNTTFTVRFAPVTAGVKVAVLHITNNDTNNNPFNLALSGTGTGASLVPGIVVQQPAGTNLVNNISTNDFGLTGIGTNASYTFIITNIGTTNLTISGITIDGTNAASFSVTNLTATLSPGGSTNFTVNFAPTNAGVQIAALHIASDDPNNNPFNIALTGTGLAATFPVIGVQQPLGTNLTNSVGTNNFGSVALGTNASLTFTITNSGSTNLTGLVITIDGSNSVLFTVTTNPVAPVVSGSNTTFTVRFAPVTAGVKVAVLHIANNDTNNNPFNIALTGTGIGASLVSGIVVQQPAGTNLVNNVSTNDFGLIGIGTNASHTFIITNIGTTNLTGLVVTIDGTNAAMFSVTTNPVAPVGPGSNTTFTVRFTPASTGLKSAALHIANNDPNNNPFTIALTGTGTNGAVIIATNLSVIVMTPYISNPNPQTGLFEQSVIVTNNGLTTAAGFRLFILNLPIDVQVYNASGTTNGIPYLQYNLPLAPAATVNFLIEYYRANRNNNFQPTFLVQETIPVSVTNATGAILSINSTNTIGGRFLIEFTATPGRTYAVQYSSNLLDWATAIPSLVAPANRVQWYDDGPPKTESLPATVGSRFYRVMQLP